MIMTSMSTCGTTVSDQDHDDYHLVIYDDDHMIIIITIMIIVIAVNFRERLDLTFSYSWGLNSDEYSLFKTFSSPSRSRVRSV